MSNSSERDWHFYVNDMITFAQKVLRYTEGYDQKSFLENELNYDATGACHFFWIV